MLLPNVNKHLETKLFMNAYPQVQYRFCILVFSAVVHFTVSDAVVISHLI